MSWEVEAVRVRLAVIVLVWMPLVFVACADSGDDAAPAPVASPSTAPTVLSLAAASAPSTPTAATASAILQHLANRLGVDPSVLLLVGFEPRQWPDGCLGLENTSSVCSQAFVAGWLATLRAPDGSEYHYRGAGARFAPEP